MFEKIFFNFISTLIYNYSITLFMTLSQQYLLLYHNDSDF